MAVAFGRPSTFPAEDQMPHGTAQSVVDGHVTGTLRTHAVVDFRDRGRVQGSAHHSRRPGSTESFSRTTYDTRG